MSGKKKDLISLLEYSAEDILNILSIARQVKQERLSDTGTVFRNKTGVMIFEKPSLRTRITFETAINELGGHPINLHGDAIGMGKRESVADIARNLERWVHVIIARTFSHETVEKLASFSSIPVINALTDLFHPCQALAFAQTFLEKTEDIKKGNVVFVGDGNNVCNSIMILCAKLGINFTLVCPQGYEPPRTLIEKCTVIGRESGATVAVTQDLMAVAKKATFIYTDVWTSMGQENETNLRRKAFEPFQINKNVIAQAPSELFVSHCLPAHRGEEITSEVLDSEHSVAFDEAENRLHVQKAVIVHLFS